ncbi:hypothetical protein Cni_G09222 [Canna indica]|uniref:SAM domain-containing protein n=1 Tax=Canna indica TaxID=4628 RepID=A0AAQ3Q7J1_9LILI|nr:hypothetical protein Cni_G09222 [Canna indica]
MDWYSWLSKTKLEPELVYHYSLILSSNELDDDDIPLFNHDLLRSMGISVAKHRLHILELASRNNKFSFISKAKSFVAWYVTKHNASAAAIVVVPRPYEDRPRRSWSSSKGGGSRMLMRNKRVNLPGGDDEINGSVSCRWESLFQDLKPT